MVLETYLGRFFGGIELGDHIVPVAAYRGNLTPIFWIPFFINETVAFAFVIHKIHKCRAKTEIYASEKPNLLGTLIKHGILYYLTYVSLFLLS